MRTVIGCAALLFVAACGSANTTSEDAIATFALSTRGGIDTYAIVPDQLRLAAARVFRDLSLRATREPLPRLRWSVRDALYAEKGVHHSLSANTQRHIVQNLRELDAAAARGDRSAVAHCARESVRLLVQDLSPAADTQAAFALTDYVLLSSQADLVVSNPDWTSLDRTTQLAKESLLALSENKMGHASRQVEENFRVFAAAVARRDRNAAVLAWQNWRGSFDRYRSAFDAPLPDQALSRPANSAR